jgi:alpha-D-ribose 1-methylphosphonate 5-phosphate C-P lyase
MRFSGYEPLGSLINPSHGIAMNRFPFNERYVMDPLPIEGTDLPRFHLRQFCLQMFSAHGSG